MEFLNSIDWCSGQPLIRAERNLIIYFLGAVWILEILRSLYQEVREPLINGCIDFNILAKCEQLNIYDVNARQQYNKI
jgi:hypothetical protein